MTIDQVSGGGAVVRPEKTPESPALAWYSLGRPVLVAIAVCGSTAMYVYSPPPLLLFTPSFVVIETSLDPKGLITDAVRRSSKAHLFHFYHVFCEIASLPRKTPSAWLSSPPEHSVGDGRSHIAQGEQEKTKDFIEFDARTLARECLKAIGQEMGLPR